MKLVNFPSEPGAPRLKLRSGKLVELRILKLAVNVGQLLPQVTEQVWRASGFSVHTISRCWLPGPLSNGARVEGFPNLRRVKEDEPPNPHERDSPALLLVSQPSQAWAAFRIRPDAFEKSYAVFKSDACRCLNCGVRECVFFHHQWGDAMDPLHS